MAFTRKPIAAAVALALFTLAAPAISFAQTTATKNKGTIYHLVLIAGAVTSLFAMTGALLSIPASRDTGMYIESADQVLKSGDTFSVQVIVVSDAPVNAFAGKLTSNTAFPLKTFESVLTIS